MSSLRGKTAVVTGASSGMGAATVRLLTSEGVTVVAGARRVDRLAELGDAVVGLRLDVTDPASSEQFVSEATHALGGIDILINSAGLALGREPFWESSEEDEHTVLETNVAGLLRMTRLCLPHIRDGGHIVNIGSGAGRPADEKCPVPRPPQVRGRGVTHSLRQGPVGRPDPLPDG